MKEYNHTEPKAAGSALVDLIWALRDGAGIDDIDEATALLAKINAASNEIQGDTDAAVLDILSGATDRFARLRQDVAVAPA